jgi:hypothetical protein
MAKNSQKTDQLEEQRFYTETERKWMEPEARFIHGKFSPEEETTLRNALVAIAEERGMTLDALTELLTNSMEDKTKGWWPKIAACLPRRSVTSVQNFCKRRFNQANYKDKWSKEHEKLLAKLVEKYGRKWTKIAAELDRTPHNVRDKWRTIANGKEVVEDAPAWSINEALALIRTVERLNGEKLIVESSDSLKEEFQKAVQPYLNEELPIESVTQHNKLVAGFIRGRLRTPRKALELYWSHITEACPGRSVDSCKAFWRCLVGGKPGELELKMLREQRHILRAIVRSKVSSADKLNFLKLKVVHGQQTWAELTEEYPDLINDFPSSLALIIQTLTEKINKITGRE